MRIAKEICLDRGGQKSKGFGSENECVRPSVRPSEDNHSRRLLGRSLMLTQQFKK